MPASFSDELGAPKKGKSPFAMMRGVCRLEQEGVKLPFDTRSVHKREPFKRVGIIGVVADFVRGKLAGA